MAAKYIFNKRPGSILKDKELHEKHHQEWSRRSFIRTTGLAGLGMAGLFNSLPVWAASRNAFMSLMDAAGDDDRILVLINLNGGNDGLNTVVEKGNDEYYRIRPTLGLGNDRLWHLDGDFGMHEATAPLRELWDNGQMKIIHNVGYPNPNYSHFRSSDIWATATDSDVFGSTGWIGRFMDQEFPAFLEAQPTHPPALQIGLRTDLVFKSDEFSSALVFRNPEEFYRLAQSGNLYQVDHLGDTPREDELRFMRRTANSAFRYSGSIREAFHKGRNNESYPNVNLGQSMSVVARMIKGGLRTKVYMVSIGGFDTHSTQEGLHDLLLERLSQSVAAFYQDIGEENSKKVLSMTFSEFGRTIFENGSQGTDHGTGAPILMFGGDIGQGHFGSPPDLLNLDHYGDPFFDVDFKDVYNTILTSWFGIDPRLSDFMLGTRQNTLPGILPHYTPPSGANAYRVLLGHRPHPQKEKVIQIQYALMMAGETHVEISDTGGQAIRSIVRKYHEAGTYVVEADILKLGLRAGRYMLRVTTGGKHYYRPLVVA
jgi:uncharacterized protein (DUF1501 family)